MAEFFRPGMKIQNAVTDSPLILDVLNFISDGVIVPEDEVGLTKRYSEQLAINLEHLV